MKLISFNELCEFVKTGQIFKHRIQIEIPWGAVTNDSDGFDGITVDEFMSKAAMAHLHQWPIGIVE